MSSIIIGSTSAALTANGGSDGFATVASNANFYPGAVVSIISGTVAGKDCLVTELSGSTKIGLRFIDVRNSSGDLVGPSYGRSDLSAYLTADTAKVFQSTQAVRVNPAFSKQDKA